MTPTCRPCARLELALALAAALAASVPAGLRAQLIRGIVRTQVTDAVVPAARVIATDSANSVLGEIRSDTSGRFSMVLRTGVPFKLSVTKIGWLPSSSELIRAARTDTLEVNLSIPADPVALPAAEVRAAPMTTPNQRAWDEATRRGWRTYAPALIERHRENAGNFLDLMREVGTTGVILSGQDCVRSVRYNRCLVYVLDGVPAGPYLFVSPKDVYFFAVLSATESAVQWGDKAPWGAIVIYTRMAGDKKQP